MIMGLYDWEMKFYHELLALTGVHEVQTEYDEYSEILTVTVDGDFGYAYEPADPDQIRAKFLQIARDCPYTTKLVMR